MADRRIFTVAFSGIAVSAAQDLLEITAPADRAIELIDVRFGQISDFGDAASEQLAVNIRRGAALGTGGTAVVPAPVNAVGKIAGSTAARNNTTAGAGGTVIIADVWNVMAPYLYRPGLEERITAQPGGRLSIGVTVPADALTMYGTATFAEIAP